jgi:hypothetical protein
VGGCTPSAECGANPAIRTATIGWTVTFPANVTVDGVPATGTYDPTSEGGASIEGIMMITANFPDTNPINIRLQEAYPH